MLDGSVFGIELFFFVVLLSKVVLDNDELFLLLVGVPVEFLTYVVFVLFGVYFIFLLTFKSKFMELSDVDVVFFVKFLISLMF